MDCSSIREEHYLFEAFRILKAKFIVIRQSSFFLMFLPRVETPRAKNPT